MRGRCHVRHQRDPSRYARDRDRRLGNDAMVAAGIIQPHTLEERDLERAVNSKFRLHTRVNIYRKDTPDGTVHGVILQHHHVRYTMESGDGWTAPELEKILRDWAKRAEEYRDNWTADIAYV